ncbi:MAG: hypothetical protein ACLQME_12355 [Alphaproteobacteria bacterium]
MLFGMSCLQESTASEATRAIAVAVPAKLAIAAIAIASLVAALAACAPIRGYPDDPEDTSATLTRLTPYFDGTEEAQYVALPNDATLRQQKRDEIVLARIRAYDIEFADFEQKLYLEGNSVSTGSDLLVLILAGLTATTGNAATKAALGAASAGVVGAQAAISKDLYYQKTIPALLEQMEANRTNAKLTIFKGLTTPDAQYPLTKAYLDLDALKAAGSIPGAIASITQQAGNAKTTAQGEIDIMRTPEYVQHLTDIKDIQAAVAKLTSNQLLALAKAIQQYLPGEPSTIQALVKGLDPNDQRLNGNAAAAKYVLNAWLSNEIMNAANKKQWTDALAKVGSP